jgi:hypothetical protein
MVLENNEGWKDFSMIRLVAGRTTVEIITVEVSPPDRIFELSVDNVFQGRITFLEHQIPAVALGDNWEIAIWGGTSIYLGSTKEGMQLFEQDDEVHTAYPLNGLWCLVREISVVLFNPLNAEMVFHYSHDEIILQSRWEGEILILKDLRGRELRFRYLPEDYNMLVI